MHMDQALARRIEAAFLKLVTEYTEHLARIRPGQGVSLLEIAGGAASYRGNSRETNQAFNLAMNGPITAEELNRVEAFFFNRDLPCRIVINPFSHPSLKDELGARGYGIFSYQNVLVKELEEGTKFTEPPEGVSIERAAEEEKETIRLIYSEGFAEQNVGKKTWRTFSEILFRMNAVHVWLGRWNGKAAGAGVLKMEDGIAFLSGSATIPDARRQGIHTAITRERMRHAAAAGGDLVMIGTMPGSDSQRNAERLGFELAYTNLVMTSPTEGI